MIENIIDENVELLISGMKRPIHFNPNNAFLEVKFVYIYENLDDIKADAIHLVLKYLTLSKNEYLEYYWQICKKR